MINNQDPAINKIDFDKKDILEIGCGYGSFTLEHLTRAKSIPGIDTNNDAIECLRKQWSTSHEDGQFIFQVGDIVDISLQDEDFDVAVFSNSF